MFDAVEIVGLPDGVQSIDAYYSDYASQQITVGDVGVVLGDWPNNKLRIEAVDDSNAIVWQDHFDRNQLKLLSPTDAAYSRRRINEHWAWQNFMDGDVEPCQLANALAFARKVAAFARSNVETLATRLTDSGYRFVSTPVAEPEPNLIANFECLRVRGVFVPVALQAWLIEIGCVDFRGTHPDWKNTAYSGMHDDSAAYSEPWYTDPLCISVSVESMLTQSQEGDLETVEIAPDAVTKANVNGAGPISMHCSTQRFDDLLIGQHGSYSLLSYLRHAFHWGGFPGFAYIPNAPLDMIQSWSRGLTQL
ncbi:MAG: hypothetical protein ABJZ55_07675 [Fuerstiella sp.]